MKTKLALAALTAFCSRPASPPRRTRPLPQKTCNANFGWWESPGLEPVFSGENGTPQV